MDKKDMLPKTKKDFEAYARAVDDANEQVIKNAAARSKKPAQKKVPQNKK